MKWLFSILICIIAVLITYSNLASRTITAKGNSLLSNIAIRSLSTPAATSTTRTSTYPRRSASTSSNMTTNREIKFSFLAREQSEGAGATVRRSIGTPKLKHLTPFLMLDQATVSPGAGFPDHPHRGQETITYLLKGGIDHEDIAGNKGTLRPGDLQFMTAGRGIVHAEMPVQDEPITVGLQLWVDLPQSLKDCPARYRDLLDEKIPRAASEDGKVQVKVISGQSLGVDSVKELAYTPVWLLDILIKPGGKITQALPNDWNAFAYTLEGAVTIANGSEGEETVTPYHNVVFEQKGDVVTAEVPEGASEDARFILVAGQPLDQNIVQYGPFVTTSKEKVYEALMDYQTGTNGFEGAHDWQSEIGKTMGRVR